MPATAATTATTATRIGNHLSTDSDRVRIAVCENYGPAMRWRVQLVAGFAALLVRAVANVSLFRRLSFAAVSSHGQPNVSAPMPGTRQVPGR